MSVKRAVYLTLGFVLATFRLLRRRSSASSRKFMVFGATLIAAAVISGSAITTVSAAQTSCSAAEFSSTTNVTYSVNGNECLIKFNSNTTTWTPPVGVNSIKLLVVAGGGGGGGGPASDSVYRDHYNAGGGGAGGVLKSDAFNVTAGTAISVSVGTGGSGAVQPTTPYNSTTNPSSGTDSIFGSLTAKGGGSGGNAASTNPTYVAPTTGGSGGGGLAQAAVPDASRLGAASNQGSFSGVTQHGFKGGDGRVGQVLREGPGVAAAHLFGIGVDAPAGHARKRAAVSVE